MNSVETVLAVAEGRTPAEIAKQAGLPLAEVRRTLDFLMKYSFVKAQGSKIKVDDALAGLPTS